MHHLDTEQGFVHSDLVRDFVGDELDADFYLCGPAPFMDVVEDALEAVRGRRRSRCSSSVSRSRRASARSRPCRRRRRSSSTPEVVGTETVTIVLGGQATEVKYQAGETFLETARRAGPPRTVLVRGGQLRDVHGAARGGRGQDAGEQRARCPTRSTRDGCSRARACRPPRPPRWCTSDATAAPHSRGSSRRVAPVSHPSLKDSAADYLREQILTGRLTPGTKIDQDEISDALGVSRLPVREALIELANEGLVDAVPRRGAFVARLERADIVDHYRIFGLVAGLAASRAATSLTDAAARRAARGPRVVRRRHRRRRAGDVEPRVPQAHQPRRWFAPPGVGARAAVAQPARALLRVRARVGRGVGAATTTGSSLRSSSATRHEAQRVMEHHVTESGELAVEILQEMGYWDGGTESRRNPRQRAPHERTRGSC